ncbi:unannotated protein [freshwater metagenome]|jgi:hypothetical protein|uniref:Unannotated protein n=1 Tax=freshwater metagenome TaxID=449393 RepID=A0A6J6BTZ0_9ZZZZ
MSTGGSSMGSSLEAAKACKLDDFDAGRWVPYP